jgi:predicted dithiol-disulfide oxidoreductase (DUF899 family)
MDMTDAQIPHPPFASPDEWLAARKALLADEKALTQQRDAVNARRRRLPMVRLEKRYEFDGPSGVASLLDLFEGRRQLIVHHFMFDPGWEQGCPSCTGHVNAYGDLSLLAQRDTTLALVSRAPLTRLEQYKAARGWRLPWYSSNRGDFNYDFQASLDESFAPIEYNYLNRADFERRGEDPPGRGEYPGMSVFFRLDAEVFHCYSTYARGVEGLTSSLSLLDLTPYGRQQDFEDSPPGWPQRPTYG